jgi:hypothetical protein
VCEKSTGDYSPKLFGDGHVARIAIGVLALTTSKVLPTSADKDGWLMQ